jgi:elongation factor G
MSYDTKNIRNVALLGHGNSGKTSLAESMLFTVGAIDRQGKVTDGNTVCDYDAEEIKRQITISASLAPVEFGGCKINVLDCPGYQDFVGEVLGSIRAAEAGLIVCSAKDGLSVGAERSWKYLKAAKKPAMFYISKLDEEHGDYYAVLAALKEKYGAVVCPVLAPMSDGTGVIDLVHNAAYKTAGGKTVKAPVADADKAKAEELRAELMEAAAGTSEELMEKYSGRPWSCLRRTIYGRRSARPDIEGQGHLSPCSAAAPCQRPRYRGCCCDAVVDYLFPAPTRAEARSWTQPAPAKAIVYKTISDQFGKFQPLQGHRRQGHLRT